MDDAPRISLFSPLKHHMVNYTQTVAVLQYADKQRISPFKYLF